MSDRPEDQKNPAESAGSDPHVESRPKGGPPLGGDAAAPRGDVESNAGAKAGPKSISPDVKDAGASARAADATAAPAPKSDTGQETPMGSVFGPVGAPPLVLDRHAPDPAFEGVAALFEEEPKRSTGSAFRQAGRRLRLRITGVTGWRRYLLALFMGGVMGLTMAPFYFLPLLPVALVTLVWLVDGCMSGGKGRRQAFATGWWFGFSYFLTGLYWIGYAFLVDAETHAWMLPFAMTALPAGLALFTGATFWLAKALWRPGAWRVLIFAACFATFELVRGHIFTGLPWNLTGYAWGGVPDMLQAVSITGIYGLSFLTLLTAASPAVLFAHQKEVTNWRWPFFAILGIGLVWTAGAARIYVAPTGPESYVPGVNLRIVQPNIPQADKWLPENMHLIWNQLLQQTSAGRGEGGTAISHVIWPEAAPPFILSESREAQNMVAAALGDAVLITGANRRERAPGGVSIFYNSLHVVAPDGEILATYDKHHLVPFGEYLPFPALLGRFGLQNLVSGSYTAGPGRRTLAVPGAPDMGPLICFEAIFPGQVVDDARRPGWLLQVTDDSWFGDSTGPRQHLGISRVRAIEEGLPLVRAANTGISAVIDPYGRTLAQLHLGETGILDSPLPAAAPTTLYARIGDLPLIMILIFIIGFAWRRRNVYTSV